MVLQIWNCVLELGNMFFVVSQILIWQGMLILENLLLDIWLPSHGELWLSNPNCKSVLHYLQMRLSSLLLLRPVKNCFGWRNLCKNLVFNNKGMFYFVIIKVLSILERILLFMVDLNILICSIIGFVIFWTLLELEKIHTDDNGSDMMTKPLPKGEFETCRLFLG